MDPLRTLFVDEYEIGKAFVPFTWEDRPTEQELAERLESTFMLTLFQKLVKVGNC